MQIALDNMFMEQALELAARGKGRTSPNPAVGALLTRGGKVIADGYHRRAGGDHAEIVALKTAGRAANGSTLYVTLEPCCHTGRTGPCTDAIIKAGVARVVFAAKDPDPRVNGSGARLLRSAGIRVTSGVRRSQAEELNESHYHFHRTGRPFVTLKLAQSLDGKLATSTGDAKWISGPKARDFAHQLRAESDAIIVGMGTVQADNPALTVRRVEGPNPYRIVVSTSLNFPRACRLIRENGDFRTIVASTESAIKRFSATPRGKRLIFWTIRSDRRGRLDIDDLLGKAAAFGLKSVLVEGGSALATSFLAGGYVDKYVAIIAPIVIGEAVSTFGNLGVRSVGRAFELTKSSVKQFGPDVVIAGYPRRRK